jgi:hypothetical protein
MAVRISIWGGSISRLPEPNYIPAVDLKPGMVVTCIIDDDSGMGRHAKDVTIKTVRLDPGYVVVTFETYESSDPDYLNKGHWVQVFE